MSIIGMQLRDFYDEANYLNYEYVAGLRKIFFKYNDEFYIVEDDFNKDELFFIKKNGKIIAFVSALDSNCIITDIKEF